ncbi:hypothetical protein [Bacillus rubiinfantis]|uniref:hypothetical protein n=1 Tax=Bacillus rubiinfantis TaxID=1499680 RepID=UPI0011DD2ADC|nr:hypothetical protein [Bacillus rubiinfantis]
MQNKMGIASELIQKCIEENARVALDQTEYQERYGGLALWFDTAKARFEEISELASGKKARGVLVEAFIAELGRQDGLITEFDERLWVTLADFATVYSETDARFTFKNGKEKTA